MKDTSENSYTFETLTMNLEDLEAQIPSEEHWAIYRTWQRFPQHCDLADAWRYQAGDRNESSERLAKVLQALNMQGNN